MLMPTRLDRAAFLRTAGVIALAAPAAPALAFGRGAAPLMNQRILGGGGFSLLKILKNIPELSELLKLVEKELKVKQLLGGGLLSGLTLFAPNNDAIIPGGLDGIQNLLKTLYSVIAPEALLLEELLGGPLGTLSQIPLDIARTHGGIFADEAKLLKGNIIGLNGVIHIIDAVPQRIL
jgi:uncharacterized surface protein with fasciclin (FAS1) repeats